METLMGIGLASSAGLNAYIPLLVLGLLSRYTHLITLPAQWQWLENPWVLGGLAALLLVEMVVDKIPVVDHINDVIQTFIRPTSGGLAFGAASGAQTDIITADPSQHLFNGQGGWLPFATGVGISFIVHAMKSAVRPVVNVTTAGFGAPVMSTAEDLVSVTMSLVAIVLPILIIGFLIGLVVIFIVLRSRRKRRKAEQAELAALRAAAAARDRPPPPRSR